MVTAGVEVPDELHLCSAVDGHQIRLDRLTEMSRLGPREALLPAVHVVAVAAVGSPEGQTPPIAGGRSRWRFLCDTDGSKVFFIVLSSETHEVRT